MMRIRRRSPIVVLAVVGFVLAAAPAAVAEKFNARIMTGGRFNSPPVLNCKISVDRYSTPEQIIELLRIMNESGYEPFMKAFRESNLGTFQVMGGRGLNVTIHATNTIETEHGRRLQLFTEKQALDVETQQRMTGKYLFMMIELDVDERGAGKGRIYPAVEITFNSEGRIEMKSYDAAPKVIFGVTRTT